MNKKTKLRKGNVIHRLNEVFGIGIKILIISICVGLSGIYANTIKGQTRIDLNFQKASLEELFNEIEKKTEFSIFYQDDIISGKEKIDLTISQGLVTDILHTVLETTDLDFRIVGKQIMVFQGNSPENILISKNDTKMQLAVSGNVKDGKGVPLPGASVVEKGTSNGTQTDFDGNFSIEVSNPNAILQVSYIGYAPKEIAVNGQSTINVVLDESQTSLDEVVIIGYGTQKKSDVTGAVAKVDGEDLVNLPSPRVDQLLQGRLAGVNVTSNSGAPGAPASIRIRGGNSISGDNEPLFVIDGFVVGTSFDLNSINVNDIESIDVLKDASSIAIYGTRGANGVVLVTTKNGKRASGEGKPIINVGMYTGMQEIAREIDFLDGPQRAQWAQEFAENSGNVNPFEGVEANTNWLDILTQVAPIANVDLSVSQSSDNVNYYFSANYFTQDGILEETGLERLAIRSNFDFQLNDKISLGARLNLTNQNQDNDLVPFGAVDNAITRSLPSYPRFNDDGSFWNQNYNLSIFDNPEARQRLNANNSIRTNFLGNFYLQFEPIKDLIIRSTFGINSVWTKNNRFDSPDLPTRVDTGFGGFARVSNLQRTEILQENTISYSKEIGENHKIDLLGGFTWQTSDTESFFASTEGLPNNQASFNRLALGDPATYDVNSGFDAFQLTSWIGRVNYSLMDRYLFTFSGRLDGTSRFASSNEPYSFFPSAAFAWRIKEEPFMKNVDMVSNLKLRASYGSSGNQSIGSYAAQASFSTSNIVQNDNLLTSVVQSGLFARPTNNELTWETTNQLDLGIEIGLFNNRLNIEADYYHKETEDLLLQRQVAGQSGFGTLLRNVGSLENKGVELAINSVNVSKNDFSWSTTLTLATNRSEVLDIGGIAQDDGTVEDRLLLYNSGFVGPVSQLIVGEQVGVFTGVEYLGTWESQEQIDASGFTGAAQPGGPRYRDTNGDGQITVEDYEIIGNPEPDFFGGIQNTFRYKNLTLDFLFQGTFGNDIYHESAVLGFFGLENVNIFQEAVNRWTPQNTDSRIPRAGSVVTPTEVPSNTELIEDGTHVRLKNVMLSYDFDVSKIDWLNNFNLYVSGSNLLLFSNFRGFDPESRSNVGSEFASGLNFDNAVRGIIRTEYPNARTISIGFNASF